MIAYLSGTDEMEIGKIKLLKKTKAERKENRKKIVSKLKENVKNPKKLIAKVAIAPARAAFLLAVNVNAVKIAKRLQQAYKTDSKKLQSFWEKFGGDFNLLKRAIETGTKTKLSGSVGVVATAATLATATPIILAAVKLFADLKSDKKGDDGEDKSVIETLKDSLNDSTEVQKEVQEEGETPFYKNPLFIGGAVLVAGGGLYLALRKK